MSEECCGSCHYYRESLDHMYLEGHKKIMVCKRMAWPTFFSDNVFFPVTQRDEWCGQWRAK